MHGAGAAVTGAASELRTDEAEMVTQHPEQWRCRIQLALDNPFLVIDLQTQHFLSPATRFTSGQTSTLHN
jgi:hypothetical protein